MKVSYKKMHGTGNVILVVDQRATGNVPPNATRLRELGNSDTGPGFDQLMWIFDANDEFAVASYRVFNADGSEVEQCGNGVRCVARHLASTQDLPQEFALQSPAGAIQCRILDADTISVSMGTPIFEPAEVPFNAVATAGSYCLAVDGQDYDVSVLSMGNPHCVLLVADVKTAPVDALGPKFEQHEAFPEKTNVGFMCINGRDSIALRVHERGVGETAACGTGACAAVVSGQRSGQLDSDVRVSLPGGEVMVSWRGGGGPVWLTGNAELISEGSIDL
ncbi:MAG: diaminopimelate epimerase [Gammaproteobacteria bacterium]|nr:diaminopimelate epimerase [Gammaproteobacteria bacterium]